MNARQLFLSRRDCIHAKRLRRKPSDYVEDAPRGPETPPVALSAEQPKGRKRAIFPEQPMSSERAQVHKKPIGDERAIQPKQTITGQRVLGHKQPRPTQRAATNKPSTRRQCAAPCDDIRQLRAKERQQVAARLAERRARTQARIDAAARRYADTADDI